jgi:hypothetical protein
MARDVFMDVQFHDAGDFANTKRFLLTQTMANDGSDIAAVLTAGAALYTVLNTLSWDEVGPYFLSVEIPGDGVAANVAANNSVEAFHRMIDDGTSKPTHFVVPAWDDDVFDKLPNGAMSSAYNAAADDVDPLTRNPETRNSWTYVQAQNRSTKRGQRQFKP